MNPSPKRSLQTIILGFVVIGLIAMALGGYLAPVSRAVLAPLIGAQTWLATRFQAIQSYLSSPQDIARLRQRNAELEVQVAQLQSEIINLKQQISQTQVLEALLEFAQSDPENRYVAAAVIGRDPSPFLQYIIINRGSDNGLRRGMPVVTQQGLVGRVAAVTGGAARVQLITDTASAINVRIEPARAQAVLQGEVTGEVGLEMIPQTAEISTGDLILTSGLGGNYPADLVVGQVGALRSRPTDLFKRASVQPVVNFSRLEIVLVITNFHPVDIAPLISTPGVP